MQDNPPIQPSITRRMVDSPNIASFLLFSLLLMAYSPTGYVHRVCVSVKNLTQPQVRLINLFVKELNYITGNKTRQEDIRRRSKLNREISTQNTLPFQSIIIITAASIYLS